MVVALFTGGAEKTAALYSRRMAAGNELERIRFCVGCGADLPWDADPCPSCGAHQRAKKSERGAAPLREHVKPQPLASAERRPRHAEAPLAARPRREPSAHCVKPRWDTVSRMFGVARSSVWSRPSCASPRSSSSCGSSEAHKKKQGRLAPALRGEQPGWVEPYRLKIPTLTNAFAGAPVSSHTRMRMPLTYPALSASAKVQ